MILKKLHPKTPGTRHQIIIEKKDLAKNNIILKKYLKGRKFIAGRSPQTGHITTHHRGGIKKKKLRLMTLTFKNAIQILITTFYDSNRNSFVCLKYDFLHKIFGLYPATEELCSGTLLESGLKTENFKMGYILPLDKIPVGTQIHSISNQNKNNIIFTRAAGCSSQILQKSNTDVKIKLTSGKIVSISSKIFATIGVVSNKNFNSKIIGKAGKRRLIGRRPIVRGVAMNPVDHPHGGQTSGGRPSVSPWGKLTKGVPTKKKYV